MSETCAKTIEHMFDDDRIVENFSKLDRLLPSVEVASGNKISTLNKADTIELPKTVTRWLERQNVTSFLVLKDNKLVHERYLLGTRSDDKRMSWSIAKSILSVLFGILHHKGVFPSLDAQATSYVPQLSGSAYDGVTLGNLLQMTSGVTFSEDYFDPKSDIRKLARYLGRGGGLDAYVATRQQRHAPPGSVWTYSSLDTHVLGMVMKGATDCPISKLLSRHLIVPLGCEAAPSYLTDAQGAAFVLGGITMRARDFARFGLMMANGGHWNGVQIVPSDWVDQLDQPRAPTPDGELKYGDQWWVPADFEPGEFMACGIYGQYIYISRRHKTVCVTTSANRAFSDPGVFEQALDGFRQIATRG